jgi:hypothetical protein
VSESLAAHPGGQEGLTTMTTRKRHSPEQVVRKLAQADRHLRAKVTRSAGYGAAALAMVFQARRVRPAAVAGQQRTPTSWPTSEPAPASNAVILSSAPNVVRLESHQLIYSP